MFPTALHLRGATHNDRHAVTHAVSVAIRESGGWLMDTHLFSNVSATLNMELPYPNLSSLGLQLAEHITLAAESSQQLAQPPPEDTLLLSADGDVIVRLQLTFVHDDPPLSREIPEVPG